MGYQLVGPIVRFWGVGWGKAQCTICACLVKKNAIISHAEYHVERGEQTTCLRAAYRSHNDVTVGALHCTQTTGWVSAATGPR